MRLTWSRIDLRLARPFVTAVARRSRKQTLWVRFDHEGVEGWGEAAPSDLYGQSLESAEAALDRAAGLLSGDPFDVPRLVIRLLEHLDDQRAAVAAVDAALHDWAGKRLGRPVIDLLDFRAADHPLTSYTIGIGSPEQTEAAARDAVGYPIWKVKVGTDTEEQTLALLRRIAPDRTIRVDANTAWPAADAPRRFDRVCRYDVELVEQPAARGDLDTLRRLRDLRRCPIVADESCVVPADVPRVASCVDGINIKLSKCGGIVQAREMIRLARAAGLKVMLGCMIESSLGIAAAAQLAPLADWLDLDGHLLLADDPFRGLGGEQAGRLTIGRAPGLGVTPRPEMESAPD